MTRDTDIRAIVDVLGEAMLVTEDGELSQSLGELAAALYSAGLRPSVEPTCPDCDHDPHVAMCYAAGPMPGDGPCGCVSVTDPPLRPLADELVKLIPQDGLPDTLGPHFRVVTVCGHCGVVWSALIPTQASDSPEKT